MVAVEHEAAMVDYETVIKTFVDGLLALRDHIIDHRVHECWANDAKQIEKGADLVRGAMYDWGCDERWNEAWDYIRDNMRGWWC